MLIFVSPNISAVNFGLVKLVALLVEGNFCGAPPPAPAPALVEGPKSIPTCDKLLALLKSDPKSPLISPIFSPVIFANFSSASSYPLVPTPKPANAFVRFSCAIACSSKFLVLQ